MTTNTRILGAMVELTSEGDAVNLRVEQDEATGRWHARIRAMAFEGSTAFDLPVFDPLHGETCLAGHGEDAAAAVSDLERVLEPFYPPQFQEAR